LTPGEELALFAHFDLPSLERRHFYNCNYNLQA